eukprot:25835-Eustigmatos_ZCMA.PRE.1
MDEWTTCPAHEAQRICIGRRPSPEHDLGRLVGLRRLAQHECRGDLAIRVLGSDDCFLEDLLKQAGERANR